mmetsp:Transcript_123044/g.359179  ORF Transcript_123044/g.359179 Transcript_123044/m.359179 type:complete len:254 (+) Transcript_123044:162-923(+)
MPTVAYIRLRSRSTAARRLCWIRLVDARRSRLAEPIHKIRGTWALRLGCGCALRHSARQQQAVRPEGKLCNAESHTFIAITIGMQVIREGGCHVLAHHLQPVDVMEVLVAALLEQLHRATQERTPLQQRWHRGASIYPSANISLPRLRLPEAPPDRRNDANRGLRMTIAHRGQETERSLDDGPRGHASKVVDVDPQAEDEAVSSRVAEVPRHRLVEVALPPHAEVHDAKVSSAAGHHRPCPRGAVRERHALGD